MVWKPELRVKLCAKWWGTLDDEPFELNVAVRLDDALGILHDFINTYVQTSVKVKFNVWKLLSHLLYQICLGQFEFLSLRFWIHLRVFLVEVSGHLNVDLLVQLFHVLEVVVALIFQLAMDFGSVLIVVIEVLKIGAIRASLC